MENIYSFLFSNTSIAMLEDLHKIAIIWVLKKTSSKTT